MLILGRVLEVQEHLEAVLMQPELICPVFLVVEVLTVPLQVLVGVTEAQEVLELGEAVLPLILIQILTPERAAADLL